MKDLLGREVQVGHHICYALTAGRSANLAVYQVKEVTGDKIKAVKLDSSYGQWGDTIYKLPDGKLIPWKHTKGKYNPEYQRVEMTEEEKFKVDNKVSTLAMPERIFILDNFSTDLFNKE